MSSFVVPFVCVKANILDAVTHVKLPIHLPHFHHQKAQPQPEQTEPIKEENPANKFPDPIFYDSIYPQKPIAYSYLALHNDKTYYENHHIPPVLDFSYVIDDLFEMIPYYEKTSELITIIDSIQNRNDINLNKQDKFGNTLLHYAIRFHNNAIFKKLLLTRTIDPNICNYSYICPIHLSIYKDDISEINSLVNYGANLQYANDRFEMPIITAIKIHHLNSIYALAQKHKEHGISMSELDYIIFTAKEEGLESVSRDLYLFFMLGKEFSY